MSNTELKEDMKIKNIQLINMKTSFENGNIEMPDEIQVRFNVGLNECMEVYEKYVDIDLLVEIELYGRDEDEGYKEENLTLRMIFVHKLTFELNKSVQIDEIDKKNLIPICLDYLYPSLRELVNIICYKMNIDPLDIPNVAEK